ncbi:Single-stranded DNA-binding protein [uncultured Thiomicrorhabdus sp.]
MSLAKVNGLFRLTRDAETKYAASGTAVTNLGLACSEKYKDKETQLFLDATAFGKAGEIISQYAGTKGTQIYLTGKLQTESWDDKNTGQKRYKTAMIIESFDFVSGQNAGQQQPQQNNQQANNFQQPQMNQQPPNDFQEDDVPF